MFACIQKDFLFFLTGEHFIHSCIGLLTDLCHTHLLLNIARTCLCIFLYLYWFNFIALLI